MGNQADSGHRRRVALQLEYLRDGDDGAVPPSRRPPPRFAPTRQMKVLHLGKFYPPVKGGMETILELICDRTSREVQSTVLVANSSWTASEERRGDVDVVRLPAIAKIGAVALCPTMPFRLAREAT